MPNSLLQLKTLDRSTALSVIVTLLLALVIWVAYFHHYQQFLLYEEDFKRIPKIIEDGGLQVWNYWLNIPEMLIEGDEEGRPFHPGFIFLFAHLGDGFGGIPAMYVIAYFVNLLNAVLFYWLMLRSTQQPIFAVTSALGFALFPVDTNHAWLTKAFGILPALTLLLIALHLYLNSTKKSVIYSYIAIFLSLLCYEKFFPLFWAAPLFDRNWKWNQRAKRQLFKHIKILIALLFVIALLRRLAGETRVEELEFWRIPQVLMSIVVGPILTIVTFARRPIESLLSLQAAWILPLGLLMLTIAFALQVARKAIDSGELASVEKSSKQFESSILPMLIRLTIVSLVELVLAYVFTLTGSFNWVFVIYGRDSLVHVASVFGAGLLCGCVCYGIYFAASRYRKSAIAILGLSLFFTLLIAFGLNVQQTFISIAQYQRSFWTDIARLCPDMTRRTIILMDFDQDRAGIERSTVFTWDFPQLLGYIYQFPADWINEDDFEQATQPKVFRLDHRLKTGWRNEIVTEDNILLLDREVMFDRKDLPGRVRSSNIILLKSQNGQLSRQTEDLLLHGKALPLKQNNSSSAMPEFEPNVLYDKLIVSD